MPEIKDRVDILNEIAEAEQHLFANVCTHDRSRDPNYLPGDPVVYVDDNGDTRFKHGVGSKGIQQPVNRKDYPITTGVLDYFPDALLEVARVSKVGNEQQNPGTVMHWDKAKSTDEADALVRHLLRRGTNDKDGLRHTAKVAWRALALLQREIEAEHKEGRI